MNQMNKGTIKFKMIIGENKVNALFIRSINI